MRREAELAHAAAPSTMQLAWHGLADGTLTLTLILTLTRTRTLTLALALALTPNLTRHGLADEISRLNPDGETQISNPNLNPNPNPDPNPNPNQARRRSRASTGPSTGSAWTALTPNP